MAEADYVVFNQDGQTLLKRKLSVHDCYNNKPKLIEIVMNDLTDNAQQTILISYAQLRKLGFIKVASND